MPLWNTLEEGASVKDRQGVSLRCVRKTGSIATFWNGNYVAKSASCLPIINVDMPDIRAIQYRALLGMPAKVRAMLGPADWFGTGRCRPIEMPLKYASWILPHSSSARLCLHILQAAWRAPWPAHVIPSRRMFR